MPNLAELSQTIADLTDVEPRTVISDTDAKEALVWHQMAKDAMTEAENIWKPIIEPLFKAHREAVAKRKKYLERIEWAVSRVRPKLANWIYTGHAIEGAYVRTSYNITITNEAEVPLEYFSADLKKLQDFAKKTDGKVHIPGCTIEPVAVLYAGKDKEEK